MRKAAVLIILSFAVLIFVGAVILQSVLILQRVAAVRDVEGQVVVRARGQDNFEPIAGKDRVFAGDIVRTSADGQLTLEWLDGTRLVVGPDTLLTVLKCQINKSNDTETSVFKLDAGSIWIRILKVLSQKSKFEITTPTATAGVRGTIFAVHVALDGETKVSVLEGQVAVTGGDQSQQVNPNTVATVAGETTAIQDFDEQEQLTWLEHQNVAEPILRIEAPADGYQAKAGEMVTIAGQSEKGAKVTVDGKPVELKIKQKFATDIAVPEKMGGREMTVTVEAVDVRGYKVTRELKIQVAK